MSYFRSCELRRKGNKTFPILRNHPVLFSSAETPRSVWDSPDHELQGACPFSRFGKRTFFAGCTFLPRTRFLRHTLECLSGLSARGEVDTSLAFKASDHGYVGLLLQ